MTLKNIIFDFDGVIVDTYDLVFKIFEEYNEVNCGVGKNISNKGAYASECKKLTDETFQGFFDDGITDNVKKEPDEMKKFIEYFFKEYANRLETQNIYKDAKNSLKQLFGKYKLFLVSSNSEVVLNHFLQKNGLDIFDKTLGFETHTSKIEKLKMLESDFGISAENSIFITDTLGDVVEACEVGYKLDTKDNKKSVPRCKVLAVTFGYHDRERLKRGKPEWIVNSWSEILNVVRGL